MFLFYILVMASPMPNHPLFEEPLAGLTAVKWLGIVCCIYAFVKLLKNPRRPAFLKSWPARFFLLLFVISTVSFMTLSKTDGLSFNPMFTYVSYVLLFFTTICLVNTYEKLRTTLLAVIAGEAWASLYVIREFQVSGGTNMRPGYVAGDSNYFATCAVLVMPLAFYLAKMKVSRLQRCFCLTSLALMAIAFTLASSRGALVGLCVAILFMVVRSGQSRRTAILAALLLVPLLLFAPSSPLSRMLHPAYGDVLGEQIRRDFWKVGLDMVRDHPVTGIGLGNFTAQSYTMTQGVLGKQGIACNTFLEVAAELGIPGLFVYGGVLIGALWSAGKLRVEAKRRADAFLLYAGDAIQAGLIGFSAAAMFVSAEYQKPFWIVVALTATVPTLIRRQSRIQSVQHGQLLMPATQVGTISV
jgi:O-antigen ligase